MLQLTHIMCLGLEHQRGENKVVEGQEGGTSTARPWSLKRLIPSCISKSESSPGTSLDLEMNPVESQVRLGTLFKI